MSKVSVVIPVYNVEKYLRECLDSVVNQTLKDIEIICVNDGSTDSSLDILNEYASKDNRIKIIDKKNTGYGHSMNVSIDNATGEYLGIVEPDDYIELDMYETLYNKAKESDLDYIKGNYYKYSTIPNITNKKFVPFDKTDIYEKVINPNNYIKTFTGGMSIWASIYKIDFLKQNKIRFLETPGASFQDTSFGIKTIFSAQKAMYLRNAFYHYRTDNINSSVKSNSKIFCICDELQELENRYATDKEKMLIINALKIDKYTWNYDRLNQEGKKKFIKTYKKEIKKIFSKKLYNEEVLLSRIKKSCQIILYNSEKDLSLMENIFNIRNSYDKRQKIITILGIKISFKSKTSSYLIKQIFSITNQDIHKVITICGIKIKIKSKKLKDKFEKNEYEHKQKRYVDNKFNQLKNEFEYKLCKYMPEEKYAEYLKDWFYRCTGNELNLDNPQTFNEKIQWMKLYDSTPLKTQLADKYLVRDWVKEKIGEEYLIPLLGVWENFADIDFDKLPDKFVLKTNHGSAWNIIVTDKNKLNKQDAKRKFDEWLHTNFAYKAGLELHYKNIKPLIIAEKYIETDDGDLKDYKFLCFNGEVKYIWVDKDRYSGHKRNLYDIDWNLLPQKISEGRLWSNFKNCNKPKNFEKMLEFAKILSKNLAFVRVDFYENKNKLYFGELTFTSASGVHIFTPSSFNLELGQLIDLTKCTK